MVFDWFLMLAEHFPRFDTTLDQNHRQVVAEDVEMGAMGAWKPRSSADFRRHSCGLPQINIGRSLGVSWDGWGIKIIVKTRLDCRCNLADRQI